jgi:hypothetical protein
VTWRWKESDSDSVDYYKKKKAVNITTIGDVEVWRDAYGCSRLIKQVDGKVYISDRDFFTIAEAKEEASKD